TFPARVFPAMPFHSRTADAAPIRRRLYRHLLYRRGSQRLALRHRLALSVGDVAVRMFSRDRPTANLSTFTDRSPHVPVRSKSANACGKRSRKAASSPGAAKHIQDLAEQFLWLPGVCAGLFCRL